MWATPFETLVPGHGAPMDRAQFAAYRQAFESFTACSASTREVADCASGWTKDVAPLLSASSMEAKRAEGMAAYYVRDVLRRHGGDSEYCKTRPGARR